VQTTKSRFISASVDSPLDAPVSLGATMQALEVALDRVLAIHILLGELHEGRVERVHVAAIFAVVVECHAVISHDVSETREKNHGTHELMALFYWFHRNNSRRHRVYVGSTELNYLFFLFFFDE
jgi:hypothetical protein